MDISDVSDALKIGSRHISVDAPFQSGEENRLLDILEDSEEPSPDFSLMSDSLRCEIKRALSSLTEREAEVVKLYDGFEKD